ncbi:hypothetical protein ACOSP7_007401 [Xanthoceras sorbifolium]|uniref:CASP-like protein n=1 Tax=Xanthoceras sorbifolium TaxID=99658 RepID=A0ABQ8IAT4_9ROSI|nr:hypothetical protein JRO89_XS03G0181800 [Xanthoceras sorbifolium]
MDGVERKMVTNERKVSRLDMVLRVLALVLTLVAAIVLGMDKQTKVVPIKLLASLPPVNVPVSARWHYLSAFKYHVVTNAIACAYAAVSLLLLVVARNKGGKSGVVVMMIIVLDLAMVALLFSSNGAAGAIGIIGYQGNSHLQWNKVCNVFGKFCDRVAVSIVSSLFAALAFFLLVSFAALRLLKKPN